MCKSNVCRCVCDICNRKGLCFKMRDEGAWILSICKWCIATEKAFRQIQWPEVERISTKCDVCEAITVCVIHRYPEDGKEVITMCEDCMKS